MICCFLGHKPDPENTDQPFVRRLPWQDHYLGGPSIAEIKSRCSRCGVVFFYSERISSNVDKLLSAEYGRGRDAALKEYKDLLSLRSARAGNGPSAT